MVVDLNQPKLNCIDNEYTTSCQEVYKITALPNGEMIFFPSSSNLNDTLQVGRL